MQGQSGGQPRSRRKTECSKQGVNSLRRERQPQVQANDERPTGQRSQCHSDDRQRALARSCCLIERHSRGDGTGCGTQIGRDYHGYTRRADLAPHGIPPVHARTQKEVANQRGKIRSLPDNSTLSGVAARDRVRQPSRVRLAFGVSLNELDLQAGQKPSHLACTVGYQRSNPQLVRWD